MDVAVEGGSVSEEDCACSKLRLSKSDDHEASLTVHSLIDRLIMTKHGMTHTHDGRHFLQ